MQTFPYTLAEGVMHLLVVSVLWSGPPERSADRGHCPVIAASHTLHLQSHPCADTYVCVWVWGSVFTHSQGSHTHTSVLSVRVACG